MYSFLPLIDNLVTIGLCFLLIFCMDDEEFVANLCFSCNIIKVNHFCIVLLYCYI